jgi:hypothetical protein
MAENATAETSMPSFMRAGMDFFTGKTVLTSTLADANQKLADAQARIAELEKIDIKALSDQIATLQGENKTHLATIKAKEDALVALEANFQTASRQSQQQVTKVGASAPVVVATVKDDSKKGFAELVAAKVATGTSKATSVSLCVKEFPAEYAEWRKNPTPL